MVSGAEWASMYGGLVGAFTEKISLYSKETALRVNGCSIASLGGGAIYKNVESAVGESGASEAYGMRAAFSVQLRFVVS